jgi:alkylation response protein AidB-like acyl-CoA dehydrogenase
MFVDYTDHQRELRREFRDYFTKLIKPEYREELRNAESGELYKELIRQQGKDNMLAMGWPEEYGGRGLTTRRGPYPIRHAEHRGPRDYQQRYR